ncbi:MAG: hypothetical protein WCG27_13545, partial [Pseudomonadota bacterium]
MLNKNVDMAIIGRSYLSFLYSLELLEKGKKVLLLDDDRMAFGNTYTNSLGQLEKDYLQLWGEEKGIAPLCNIDQYLKKKILTFVVGDKRLWLGDSPSANLTEITRKFFLKLNGDNQLASELIYHPQFLKNLDENFFQYCRGLADGLNPNKKLKLETLFTEKRTEELTMIHQFFKHIIGRPEPLGVDQNQYWTLKTLFFMAQGHFQKKLSLQIADSEFFHLLLTLLSPRYELDHEKLMADLMSLFQARGGQFKQTRVREWLFYDQRPWSMELASYEGIIHPKEISLLGSNPQGLSLEIFSNNSVFSCLNVDWELNEQLPMGGIEEGQNFIFSSV